MFFLKKREPGTACQALSESLAQRPKSLAGVWYESLEINCISLNSVVEPRIYTISYQTTPRHYYLLLQCMFSLPMAPSSYITCILPSWSSEVGSFWEGGLPGSLREPGRRAWQDFGEPGTELWEPGTVPGFPAEKNTVYSCPSELWAIDFLTTVFDF